MADKGKQPIIHRNVHQPMGVATTTPVALYFNQTLYLERMNIIAGDGAGILCPDLPTIGDIIPLVFRLSTAKDVIRCKGEVLDHYPTSPYGLTLKAKMGEKQFKSTVGSAIGDSATAIFRLSDLEKPSEKPRKLPKHLEQQQDATGFALRFTEIDDKALKTIQHHIRVSTQLRSQLAQRGDKFVSITEDDRPTISSYFDEGDLSKRAMDW